MLDSLFRDAVVRQLTIAREAAGGLTVLGVQQQFGHPEGCVAAPSRSRFGNALLIPHNFRAARVGRQCFTPKTVKHPSRRHFLRCPCYEAAVLPRATKFNDAEFMQ